MELWILLTVGLLNSLHIVSGQSQDLVCYRCVSQAGDTTCLDDPNRVPQPNTVDCTDGWCTTTRKEFTEVPGKIVHFSRNCASKGKRPEFLDNIIHDAHFTTYYTTCRTLRCNSGDGLKENSGGAGGGDNTGFIIVNGEQKAQNTSSEKNNAENTLKINMGLLCISSLIYLILW